MTSAEEIQEKCLNCNEVPKEYKVIFCCSECAVKYYIENILKAKIQELRKRNPFTLNFMESWRYTEEEQLKCIGYEHACDELEKMGEEE